jgi:hypothetical protein
MKKYIFLFFLTFNLYIISAETEETRLLVSKDKETTISRTEEDSEIVSNTKTKNFKTLIATCALGLIALCLVNFAETKDCFDALKNKAPLSETAFDACSFSLNMSQILSSTTIVTAAGLIIYACSTR